MKDPENLLWPQTWYLARSDNKSLKEAMSTTNIYTNQLADSLEKAADECDEHGFNCRLISPNDSYQPGGRLQALARAAAAQLRLSGPKTPQWIPVSERLPAEEIERVLLYIAYDDEVAIGILYQAPERFVKDDKPFYGVWIREAGGPDDDGGCGHVYCYPSHWMPMEEVGIPATNDH